MLEKGFIFTKFYESDDQLFSEQWDSSSKVFLWLLSFLKLYCLSAKWRKLLEVGSKSLKRQIFLLRVKIKEKIFLGQIRVINRLHFLIHYFISSQSFIKLFLKTFWEKCASKEATEELFFGGETLITQEREGINFMNRITESLNLEFCIRLNLLYWMKKNFYIC